jgi:3-deoxy-D-manno-octulosonic-acid transferase
VVDSIGILSHLYQYADIAYIGGGFGVGIHNTLEAATFGVPVIFGPNYHKFQEAQDLIDEKAAFPMATSEAFSKIMAALVTDYSKRSDAGKRAHTFVSRNKGGTALILDSIIVR